MGEFSLLDLVVGTLFILLVIFLLAREHRLTSKGGIPGSINLQMLPPFQILPPFLIVECVQGEPCRRRQGWDNDYTFEVWSVPENPRGLFGGIDTRATLLHTFAGEFMEARSKCRAWIDEHHLDYAIIWAELGLHDHLN